MAAERKRNEREPAQATVHKGSSITRSELNFESNLNKRQVVTGQVGGMRGEGLGFRCTLCDLRFKDNLKFVDHLNSPQHMMNSGEKMVGPSTLEDVKERYELLVRRKYDHESKAEEKFDIKKRIEEYKDQQVQAKTKRQQATVSKEKEQPKDEMSQMMGFAGFGSTKK